MGARINVQIKNQFGETEDETTVTSKTFAGAARKAYKWLGRTVITGKLDKSTRIGNFAWWILRPV